MAPFSAKDRCATALGRRSDGAIGRGQPSLEDLKKGWCEDEQLLLFHDWLEGSA